MRLMVGFDGNEGGRDALELARTLAEPAGVTTEIAKSEQVDLLVAGSRRYGPVMRALLGSVSTQLIHQASCPVLVEPRP
jgi:nucleotide-binding universal stress UspA family protein